MTGKMYMNGREYSKSMRKKIAYVMQEDIFFMNLTVHEQLTFTCQLRLPESVGHTEKVAAVDHVVRTLGIEKCQHTKIMLVSGGEKKRCNIGTELLTNPSLILLDEPTSGLDSTAAAALMKTMRGLANDRMTVIMSIHQPSSQVFYSFDQLMLLADGHTVYYGSPRTCLSYLATLSFIPPADYNPADYVMDLVNARSVADLNLDAPADIADDAMNGAELRGKELTASDGASTEVSTQMRHAQSAESAAAVDASAPRAVLIRSWDNAQLEEDAVQFLKKVQSKLSGPAVLDAAAGVTDEDTEAGSADKEEDTAISLGNDGYSTHYHTQFRVLLSRAFMNSKAELFTFLNAFQTVALAVACGLAWWQMGRKEKSISDRGGFIFFYMVYWFFNSMFTGMMTFFPERAVITKERAAGSYHLSAYFITKNISETPLVLALPAVFLAISYPMAGLNPRPGAFFGMVGTQLLATTCGESIGLLIGTATNDIKVGVTAATLIGLCFMLVGGYFVQNLAGFVIWFRYLSPVKYSYDACIQIEFTEPVQCDGSGVLSECEYQDEASVQQVHDYFGIDGSIGFNIGMLAVLAICYRIMSYFCLRFLKFNQGRT
jgi:ABC-type multidrug transport system ATPase subunit